MVGRLGRVLRVFLWLPLITMTLVALLNVIVAINSKSYSGVAIGYDDSVTGNRSLDLLIRTAENASEAGQPIYIVKLSSPVSDTLVNQAKLFKNIKPDRNLVFGVFDNGTKTPEIVEGTQNVGQKLESILTSALAAKRTPLPWLIGLLLLGLGVIISKWFHIPSTLAMGIAAIGCAYLFYTRCKVCESATVLFNFDISVIASVWFLLGAFATQYVKIFNQETIGTIVFGSSIAVQSILFFVEPSACWICISILGLSSLSLGTWFALTEAPKKIVRNSIYPYIVASLVVGLVVSGFAQITTETEQPFAVNIGKEKSLIGKHLKELMIEPPIDLMTKLPTNLLIGSPDCNPCRFAEIWALQKSNLPFIFVSANSTKSISNRANLFEKHTLNGKIIVPSPTILSVNKHGIIVDQIVGWADSTGFEQAVKLRLSAEIKPKQLTKSLPQDNKTLRRKE